MSRNSWIQKNGRLTFTSSICANNAGRGGSAGSSRLALCLVHLLALAVLSGPGCTTLRTTSEPVGGRSYAADNNARVGLYYFLPRAIITIECTRPQEGIFAIAVTKAMVADRRHRYHLRWTANAFYDDKTNKPIAVDADGLLTNVEITATDQTPAIATDLLSTVVNVFKIASGGVAQSGDEKRAKDLEPFKYSFDPLNDNEVKATRGALLQYGIDVRIDNGRTPNIAGTIYEHSKEIVSTRTRTALTHQGADTPDDRGVFFHPPTTVEMRLDLRSAGAEVIHRENIAIPDTDRVACFRFGRAPLVKRDTILALSKGVPVSVHIEQNSVVKSFTGILSSLTGAVANAVPTLVNVRTSRETAELNAEKTRLSAEREMLAEQTKLLEEKKALLEAEKALTEAKISGGNSGNLEDDTAGEFEPAGGSSTAATPTPTP